MSTVEELKSNNIQLIRRCFYCGQNTWTRPQLSGESGLSMAGVTNVLKILAGRCEILADGAAPSTGGRRSKIYRLNPDYGHIGILFLSHPADSFLASAESIDLDGQQICKTVWLERTETSGNPKISPDPEDILDICHELIHKDPLVQCLVVSFPGIVSSEGMPVRGDFPKLLGINIRELFRTSLSIPVQVENDVNLAVQGYSRQHPECQNLAVLYQPARDGAGAGLVVDGRLVRGRSGFAGEIGYPFRDIQKGLLQSAPLRLVALQLKILAAVTEPERIVWICPSLPEHAEILLDDIPEEFRPVLEQKPDMDGLIRSGAELSGRMALLESI